MRNRCSLCGGWNDPMQWPEAERENYDPQKCYVCARQAHVESDDAKEEESNAVTPEEDAADLDAMEKEAIGGYDD